MKPWWIALCGFVLVVTCTSPQVEAQAYLSEQQALKLAFGPGEKPIPVTLESLSDTQRNQVKEDSGIRFSPRLTRCWQGTAQGKVTGYACVDNQIGKTEFITYLVKIAHPQGEIEFLELMVYRESEGGQVAHRAFKAQFQGKDAQSPVRLGRDLRNISGATLSAQALAQGARLVLSLYEVYLKPLGPLGKAP